MRRVCRLLALLALGLPLLAQADSPRVNYILHCQGCHLPDGAGTPGKVPPLKDHVGKFLHADGGREYLMKIPGVAYSTLSDAEVAEVLNWMLLELSPAQLPPDFEPYTAAEVARHRHPPLVEVWTTRAALLNGVRTKIQ